MIKNTHIPPPPPGIPSYGKPHPKAHDTLKNHPCDSTGKPPPPPNTPPPKTTTLQTLSQLYTPVRTPNPPSLPAPRPTYHQQRHTAAPNARPCNNGTYTSTQYLTNSIFLFVLTGHRFAAVANTITTEDGSIRPKHVESYNTCNKAIHLCIKLDTHLTYTFNSFFRVNILLLKGKNYSIFHYGVTVSKINCMM
jgi:hypothetical protein